jgi:Cu2+-exporting ATPase
MRCAGCVKVVEQQLKSNPGVISACVNLVTEVAVVEYEIGRLEPATLAEKLTSAGFPTQPRYGSANQTDYITPAESHRREIKATIWRLIVAGALIVLSGLGHLGQHFSFLTPFWFHWGLATATLLGPGRSIIVDGFWGIRRLAPNMNTLVGLGAVTAYTTSVVALLFPQLGWECFFDEPVMLLGFILLGRTLEQQARGRAASAFEALLSLQPTTARLVKTTSEKVVDETSMHQAIEIPADQVRIGEWLQVLPGEKIPTDGEVVAGKTTVDESMLTGEPMPVLKQPGDLVAAGTLNQSGVIVLRATRTGKDTTIAQIVALVEAAQTRKAPVQKLADTVAGYFTYGVMTAAALTFVFWYFIGTHLWPDVVHEAWGMGHGGMGMEMTLHPSPLLLSLKLAIAVLVVACPCALGLATPTAILVGTSIGAERGILIKGGDVLERVRQLDTIVFDKTGTLTLSKPTVTDCIPVEGIGHGEDGETPRDGDAESQGAKSKDRETGRQGDAESQGAKSKDRETGRQGDAESKGAKSKDRETGRQGDAESQDVTASPFSLVTASLLLQLAAAAESGTCHPLATAIGEEAKAKGLSIPAAQDFYTEAGLGVSATVAGQQVLVGGEDWLMQQGVSMVEAVKAQAQGLALAGKTVVYVAVEGRLAGVIAVTDALRPDAKTTVDSLRQMGLRVMILTGDRYEAAVAIAQTLGLDAKDVKAGVRPDGKVAAIQQMQTGGHRVAMIGDGINDAPALAQADAGIALQAGTDVAIESAQIILMRSRLSDIVESIRLSRATVNKIRQNLFWALAYNTLGIPIAAGILAPVWGIVLGPAGAGAMMAFSSVSVVTNSLLLRRTNPLCTPVFGGEGQSSRELTP